jgi:ureidoglycolate dehydrogenase (NAD+)
MKSVLIEDLTEFSEKVLKKSGVSEEDASIITDVLITTDTFGIHSHGIKNLYPYVLKIQAGGLNPKAVPEIEVNGSAWAVINGNAAVGMVSACKAMDLAIAKARLTGIAYVGVRNSCHFGAAGYYSNMAAKTGMFGIAMSNTDPNMAIPNSAGVAIGNNPFSFAVPFKNNKSVFLDIAMSNVAALKVIMAKEKGEFVPKDWLVDVDGKPTCNPSNFPNTSFLQPMAAHKGYGLAIMIEILSSVITCSGMLSQICSWNLNLSSNNNVGHAFIAIDISRMIPLDTFLNRMEYMVAELKNTPKAKDAQQIFVPGEIEWVKREQALKNGCLVLTDDTVKNMEKLSETTGIKINWLED